MSIHIRMTYLKGFIRSRPNQKVTTVSWDSENDICSKVTKIGSMIGHRIDYNGVGVWRGQWHIPSKN